MVAVREALRKFRNQKRRRNPDSFAPLEGQQNQQHGDAPISFEAQRGRRQEKGEDTTVPGGQSYEHGRPPQVGPARRGGHS